MPGEAWREGWSRRAHALANVTGQTTPRASPRSLCNTTLAHRNHGRTTIGSFSGDARHGHSTLTRRFAVGTTDVGRYGVLPPPAVARRLAAQYWVLAEGSAVTGRISNTLANARVLMWLQYRNSNKSQYAYSAWAPQFADKLQLSATQSNVVVRQPSPTSTRAVHSHLPGNCRKPGHVCFRHTNGHHNRQKVSKTCSCHWHVRTIRRLLSHQAWYSRHYSAARIGSDYEQHMMEDLDT